MKPAGGVRRERAEEVRHNMVGNVRRPRAARKLSPRGRVDGRGAAAHGLAGKSRRMAEENKRPLIDKPRRTALELCVGPRKGSLKGRT